MKARLALVLFMTCLVTTAVFPSTPTHAAGPADVQFTVGGTLLTFPCITLCTTTFSGTGSGAGHITHTTGSVVYDTVFEVRNGTVTGSAQYTEPGGSFCPAFASATSPTTGLVTLTGGANGVIYRTTTPNIQGTVTGVTFTLSFSYTRVGVTPVLQITGGTVRVNYVFPGTGIGFLAKAIVQGAGPAVFNVDPVLAKARCTTPGSLPYQVIGNVDLALI